MSADWTTYTKMLDALGNRSAIRLTYDRGTLELMSPSYDHEKGKTTFAALLDAFLVHQDVDFDAGGSTTFRVEALQKGLEPDECYWIKNANQLQGAWNSETDPYPDLVLEVEVSRSAIDRLGIFASLGVAEVWRLDSKGGLHCHHLSEQGKYELSTSSKLLPDLSLPDFERFLNMGQEHKLGTVLKAFRTWLLESTTR